MWPFQSLAKRLRNQETNERTIEAMIAVLKSTITNPGTTFEVTQSKTTLIKKAVIPKVIIEIGRVIICKIGLMNVLTMPKITDATTAVQRLSRWNPGTIYCTTKRAKTFIANLAKSLMRFSIVDLK